MNQSLVLRDYQLDGVERLRTAFRSGKTAPLYVLPTGGGKTAVFSFIAQNATALERQVLILVHRHELLMQTSKSLSSLGVAHGLISPKFCQSRELVQVGSVQTVVRRLGQIQIPDLIIPDEAHHSVSPTYRTILTAYPKAHILGVTATPIRGDGVGLGLASGGIFDDIILGPSISELISRGYLVTPEVYAPPVGIDLAGVHKRMGDYDKRELGDRVDKAKITGDAVDHYLRLCPGQPAIAFCVSVAHAEHVALAFRTKGLRSCRVDGAMDDHARRTAIEGLANGAIDVLTSADLIGEGIDIPRVKAAILLRPTCSTSLYLQQVGRALRPYEGKKSALILDHVGNTLRHGFPDDDREWQLNPERHVKSRKEEDELKVRITQCTKCFFVYEPGPDICPQCGNQSPQKIRKIEVEEGELKKITRAEIEAARMARQKERGSARTLEELVKLGKQKGYHPGWAKRYFEARMRRK